MATVSYFIIKGRKNAAKFMNIRAPKFRQSIDLVTDSGMFKNKATVSSRVDVQWSCKLSFAKHFLA